ncbi:hypothetical protein [Paenibacillus popilliae]|uniref:Uncharacterized protein n=1 Tax=Paenibacillus popilliae TaxID=78057 RepID=A0ABY3AQF7_PAEPP|nr:hypothetical protein [Paenibacillus sp. SDF0028]TQR44066.1 hypothetical protein C7Y44_18355 [Paenibacillus sp. SDF0028]
MLIGYTPFAEGKNYEVSIGSPGVNGSERAAARKAPNSGAFRFRLIDDMVNRITSNGKFLLYNSNEMEQLGDSSGGGMELFTGTPSDGIQIV